MVIRRGGIYWIDFWPGKGSEPRKRRPGLVL
ncbi:MAG: type II toxin-antitoxin system PemK/MazF family toxin, partial [Desulfococcaceae bacterium]